jgi:DNA-binding NarL/FixJ family response regulator
LEQLSLKNDQFDFEIDTANCCDSALSKFKTALKNQPYDLVFLDIRLPSENSKIPSGEELGFVFKDLHPKVKLIVITGHYEEFVFHNILQNISPEGLLYKSDIGLKTINEVIENVLNDIPYYSSHILQLLRKSMSSKIVLSRIDKLLLYELAKGSKTKDLKEVLPLSQGGVEKRKRYLRDVFEASNLKDEELIKSAQEKGFI